MNALALLLAAGWQELISVLVALVFLVFWVLGQIGDAKKKQGMVAGQRPVQPPRPPQPAGVAGGGQQADPLRAQVDEFLRRAEQRGGQPRAVPGGGPMVEAAPRPARQPAAAGHEEIVVLLDDVAVEPQRRPLSEPLRAAREGEPKLRAVESPRPSRRGALKRQQSVAEHVQQRVGAAAMDMRDEVSHLGERVIQADAQFDVDLHHRFDHQLGSLAGRRAERMKDQQAVVAADSPAAQIAAMLANPDGVRQAIVINEILRRPVDRW